MNPVMVCLRFDDFVLNSSVKGTRTGFDYFVSEATFRSLIFACLPEIDISLFVFNHLSLLKF